MAQTRNQPEASVDDVVLSHRISNTPSAAHYTALVAHIGGKPALTVRAKAGVRMRGWAPGDDTDEPAEMLAIPVGGLARVVVDPDGIAHQDKTVLALLCARGTIDILEGADAKAFHKARPHREIHDEHRLAELEDDAKRSGNLGNAHVMQAEIVLLRERVAELEDVESRARALEARLDSIEQANAAAAAAAKQPPADDAPADGK